MKIQAMLDWSPEEKAAKVKEWAQSLFTLRLQKATGQLENPMKLKELRKDIARLKTAQHMSAAETAAAAAHEVAQGPGAEEKISANEEKAAASPKPARAAGASGKGAKKRAAAAAKGAKKAAGAAAKAHAPSKKSSEPSGKKSAGSKARSAAGKKSKKT
jgi:large subunit ribosomal protein L29